MRTILFLLLSLLVCSSVGAQTNCSVNAGSPELYCIGEDIKLRGAISGEFDISTVNWELISAPTGSNIQIDDSSSISGRTSAANIPGDYSFRISLTCEIGEASQTVTHTVNPKGEGQLIFPDLDCFREQDTFIVYKIITPGNFFIYDFEVENKFKIVEQFPDSLRLVITGCIEEEFYYPQYRVSNQFGCSQIKMDTMMSVIDYIAQVNLIIEAGDECGVLIGYCPSIGQPQWSIASAPPGSIATLTTPNSKNTEVCNLTPGGNYNFQYDIIDPPCEYFGSVFQSEIEIDSCLSQIVNTDRRVEKYCPGSIPANAVLSFGSSIQEGQTIFWYQDSGPDVILIGIEELDLTVNGLESGNIYTFIREVYDPINDCTYVSTYVLYEVIIDPDVDFVIRDESFQFCTTAQNCNNQYRFTDGNDNDFFDINMTLELLSYPPDADISLPFFVNFDTPSNQNVPLAFSDLTRVHNFFFESLRLNATDGGSLSFNLCSEMTPGSYSFRLKLENDCFLYEEEMILVTNPSLNKILPNAGTDQVLPCNQTSTSIVGNEMGWDNLISFGIWSTIAQPANTDNPIPNTVQGQLLELENLSPGQYTFRYFHPYNDPVSQNQNLCDQVNRYDDVSVFVSELEPISVPIVPDELFCIASEYCIEVPIDDTGSSTRIVQVAGPTTNIPEIEFGGLVCFDDLQEGESYSFEYIVDNGCSEYIQSFDIEITNSFISQALVINQDTCVIGNAPSIHELMAAPVADGIGEWTYIGSGTAIFSPSAASENATATIANAITYPIYREFIWTVTNSTCGDINQDKFVFKNNGYVPIEIDPLYIDCNATFPYSLNLEPSGAIEGVQVEWQLLSLNATSLPEIISPTRDTTEIIFNTSGTYIFEVKYFFDGDCGENEEEAVVEVRLSESNAFAYAGEDLYLCESTFQLDALDPDGLEGFWSVSSSDPINLIIEFENSQDFQTSVSFLEQGNATLVWNLLANDANCGIVSQDEVFLSWQEFELDSTGAALCNESVFLIEHSPVDQTQVIWTLLNGPNDDFTISPIDGSSTVISNLSEGVFNFQYIYTANNSDCSSSGTIQVAILGIGEINDEQSYCDVENNTLDDLSLNFNLDEFTITEVMLQDRPVGSLDGISPSINQDVMTFTYNGFDLSGNYVFEITGFSEDCEVSAFLTITIGAPPVDDLPSSLSFCAGDNAFLNPLPDNDLYYQWSPANLVSDPLSPNPQFVGSENGTVNVIVSGSPDFNDCVADKNIEVSIATIDAIITPPQVLCEYEEVIIQIIGDDLNLTIEWSDSNNNILGTESSISLNPEEDMMIVVTMSNAIGCELTLSTTIEISPLIEGVSAEAEPILIELGESTQLNVNNNLDPLENCNIEWTPAESLDDPNSANPMATPVSNQTFEVIVEKDGCIARDLIDIEVDNSCLTNEYFIPNTFTPNGDGHNDCFQVYGNMQDFELYIFDRWGEEIIVITETNDCWDGTYKSQDLPPDVYAYYVKHIRCDGEELEFRGNVTLLK